MDEQTRVLARPDIVPKLTLPTLDPVLSGSPDAFSLWQALQEVLVRIESMGPVMREVARPKVTIRQQMLHILDLLAASPDGVSFSALIFYPERDTVPTRLEVIITFLALLELMRLHRVAVVQKELFGDILLCAVAPEQVTA